MRGLTFVTVKDAAATRQGRMRTYGDVEEALNTMMRYGQLSCSLLQTTQSNSPRLTLPCVFERRTSLALQPLINHQITCNSLGFLSLRPSFLLQQVWFCSLHGLLTISHASSSAVLFQRTERPLIFYPI